MNDLSRADLVIRNARVLNSYIKKFIDADIFIKDGRFLYIDTKKQNEMTADEAIRAIINFIRFLRIKF